MENPPYKSDHNRDHDQCSVIYVLRSCGLRTLPVSCLLRQQEGELKL